MTFQGGQQFIATSEHGAMMEHGAISTNTCECRCVSVERGFKQGIEQGERSLILRLLSRRVGTLPLETRSQVEALSLERIELLGEALLDFSSADDLDDWLRSQP